MLADDTNVTASVDRGLIRQEDKTSVVMEDDNVTSKSDEPSVHCLAADLLSAWHSLKVCLYPGGIIRQADVEFQILVYVEDC